MRLNRPTADIEAKWLDGHVLVEESVPGPGLVLAASGELDLAAVPELREHLEKAVARGVNRIVLDLAEVSFIDSVSLAAVVATKRRLGDGGRLAVVAQHPYVLLIFEAGGLDSVVELFATREEAVAYVQG